MKSSMLATLLFVALCLASFSALTALAQCSMSAADLRAARLTAVRQYEVRLNGDIDQYTATCNRYYDPEVEMAIRGIGHFHTKPVSLEYGWVLFNSTLPAIRDIWTGTLNTFLDETSITWVDEDTVQFYQTCDVYLGVDWANPGHYAFVTGGTRNFETLRFRPCTDLILSDIVVNDPLIMPVYQANEEIDIASLCDRIMSVCTGSNAAYASLQECQSFMNTIEANALANPPAACPYHVTSNSTTCRNFHATNSIIDPITHCPHTSPSSEMCVDTCRPACDLCPAHSSCQATFASSTDVSGSYSCRCDSGYVPSQSGPNGALACVPVTCTQDWQCGQPYGFCNQGQCACPNTFEWDPINGGCKCPDSFKLEWNIPANNRGLTAPACMPIGSCLAREHCSKQEWNTVQCGPTTPLNVVSPWNSCLCTYGFQGGFQSPCVCPYGNSRVFWSTTYSSNVCLAPGECTDSWHCSGSNPSCSVPSGSKVGTCRNN